MHLDHVVAADEVQGHEGGALFVLAHACQELLGLDHEVVVRIDAHIHVQLGHARVGIIAPVARGVADVQHGKLDAHELCCPCWVLCVPCCIPQCGHPRPVVRVGCPRLHELWHPYTGALEGLVHWCQLVPCRVVLQPRLLPLGHRPAPAQGQAGQTNARATPGAATRTAVSRRRRAEATTRLRSRDYQRQRRVGPSTRPAK